MAAPAEWNLLEIVGGWMVAAAVGAIAQQQAGVKTGGGSGIQFGLDIAQKQDFVAGKADLLGNSVIARAFAFGADAGVEVAAEERGEVAILGVGEQQSLRLDRAGGVDIEGQATPLPVAQGSGHLGVDVGGEVALLVTFAPDQPFAGSSAGSASDRV
jgi:hypothetical protein